MDLARGLYGRSITTSMEPTGGEELLGAGEVLGPVDVEPDRRRIAEPLQLLIVHPPGAQREHRGARRLPAFRRRLDDALERAVEERPPAELRERLRSAEPRAPPAREHGPQCRARRHLATTRVAVAFQLATTRVPGSSPSRRTDATVTSAARGCGAGVRLEPPSGPIGGAVGVPTQTLRPTRARPP